MSATDTTQPEFSAEDLELLTPEERAAISDGAEDAANQEALAKLAAGAPDDDDDDGDENETLDENGNVVEPAPAASTPAPAPAAPPAAEPAPQPQVDTTPKPAPVYATLPEDFSEKVSAVEASIRDIENGFSAGSIDVDEYRTQLKSALATQAHLESLKSRVDDDAKIREESAKREWEHKQEAFATMAAKPENGGIDYRNDAEKLEVLNRHMRALANDDRNKHQSMDWYLNESHSYVKFKFGIRAEAPKPADPPASRKPPIGAAPLTLAQVPGADGPGDVSDEFSQIDHLEGWAYEDALRRLDQNVAEKYIKGRSR